MNESIRDWQRRGDLWWLVNRHLGDRTDDVGGFSSKYMRSRVASILFVDDCSWKSCCAQIRDLLADTGWERDETLALLLSGDLLERIDLTNEVERSASTLLNGVAVVRSADNYNIGALEMNQEIEVSRSVTYLRRAEQGVALRVENSTACGAPLLNGRTHVESEAELALLLQKHEARKERRRGLARLFGFG